MPIFEQTVSGTRTVRVEADDMYEADDKISNDIDVTVVDENWYYNETEELPRKVRS